MQQDLLDFQDASSTRSSPIQEAGLKSVPYSEETNFELTSTEQAKKRLKHDSTRQFERQSAENLPPQEADQIPTDFL
jgi:hypothetical protein